MCARRVRFVVVGAHALAASGRPRATQDIDFFIEPTRENARRLGRALADFGFTALAAEWEQFSHKERMATLGREPLRIDVMTSISGVSFGAAWRGRLKARLAGRVIGFLGERELRRNKLASGRLKDRLDVALLDEARPARRRKPRRR